MNKTKLWAVKAFMYEEDKNRAIINRNGRGKVTGIMHFHVRKLVLIAKNLTWEKAKSLRHEYRRMGAIIFVTPREEELKVIQLG